MKMSIAKWFSTGFESVREYSDELDRKAEMAKNRRPFIPNLILADGESRTVRFITTTPLTFREHYLPNVKGKKFYTCLEGMIDEKTGDRIECPFCSSGNKATFRGAFLVIDRDIDRWTDKEGTVHEVSGQIKIFKQGIKVLKVLDKMSAKRDLKEWDIEITRTGESTDTQYNFIPEEKFPLTEDEIKEIDEFKGDKTLLDKLAEELTPMSVEDAMTVLRGGTPAKKPSETSYQDDDTIGF